MTGVPEAALDRITEAACRYFCGWKPHDPPRAASSYPRFREAVLKALAEED